MASTGPSAGPLSLSAMGSFTVGGRRLRVSGQPAQVVAVSRDLPEFVVDPNGTYRVEHAYVQYFIPAEPRHLPVVLLHGGGLTGSCWEGTPDGRAGWVEHFLRAGHPVYVVDNAERGRAGWWPLPGLPYEERPVLRSAEAAWETFRIGLPGGYDQLRPFPGCLFPVDHFDHLCSQVVPRWSTTTDLGVAAIEALLAKIGRCVVIAHSQGGGVAAHAAERDPDHVAALVLLEPHGLPTPPKAAPAGPTPQLIVAGDFIEQSTLYRHLRARWHTYLDDVRSLGARADFYDLPAMGHPGNSHMVMMDGNSDLVACLVQQWLVQATTQGEGKTPRHRE
ncbi:MAG TPA: alpha/beta fold hydrolase [Amycolatopsis sp.]|nr:alpha/beta fold hydrolase [Amycolatopsis sp.]